MSRRISSSRAQPSPPFADPQFDASALEKVLLEELDLPQPWKVCVAFSGGLDSTALLYACQTLGKQGRLCLRAVHIHHGLAAQADFWAEHCIRIAAAWQLPCQVEQVSVDGSHPEGLESAARKARYHRLGQVLAAGEVLLTGHHRDDQAETVLLRLLRGTGAKGLAGMRLKQSFAGGWLLRPLLGFSRSSLRGYARTQGLAWVEDTSNRDTRISRNYLRHQVGPGLTQHWPGWSRAVSRAARHLGETDRLLTALAAMDLVQCHQGVRGQATGVLSIQALSQLEPARRRNLLRYWLAQRGIRGPSERRMWEIDARMFQHPSPAPSVGLECDRAVLRRYRDGLYLLPQRPVKLRSEPELSWNLKQDLVVGDNGLRLRVWRRLGVGLAPSRLVDRDIQVRWRQGGERCRLARRVHHQQLKKLFQQWGVPPWERDRVPLIYVDGELAMVAGFAACEPFAAKPGEEGLWVDWGSSAP